MGKTKIDWADYTISPITGCNNFNTKICGDYCYARKMAHRLKGRYGYSEDDPFRPAFHPEKLQDIYNLPKGHKRVFLTSMGDWFSEGVDPNWIEATLSAVRLRLDHTFLVLTKRPEFIPSISEGFLDRPQNLWVGVSVTNQIDAHRIDIIRKMFMGNLFVSFEPLHSPIIADLSGVSWVILGAESGNRKGKIIPKKEWITEIIGVARDAHIPVFVKRNITELY
jgi:protein gp37